MRRAGRAARKGLHSLPLALKVDELLGDGNDAAEEFGFDDGLNFHCSVSPQQYML